MTKSTQNRETSAPAQAGTSFRGSLGSPGSLAWRWWMPLLGLVLALGLAVGRRALLTEHHEATVEWQISAAGEALKTDQLLLGAGIPTHRPLGEMSQEERLRAGDYTRLINDHWRVAKADVPETDTDALPEVTLSDDRITVRVGARHEAQARSIVTSLTSIMAQTIEREGLPKLKLELQALEESYQTAQQTFDRAVAAHDRHIADHGILDAAESGMLQKIQDLQRRERVAKGELERLQKLAAKTGQPVKDDPALTKRFEELRKTASYSSVRQYEADLLEAQRAAQRLQGQYLAAHPIMRRATDRVNDLIVLRAAGVQKGLLEAQTTHHTLASMLERAEAGVNQRSRLVGERSALAKAVDEARRAQLKLRDEIETTRQAITNADFSFKAGEPQVRPVQESLTLAGNEYPFAAVGLALGLFGAMSAGRTRTPSEVTRSIGLPEVQASAALRRSLITVGMQQDGAAVIQLVPLPGVPTTQLSATAEHLAGHDGEAVVVQADLRQQIGKKGVAPGLGSVLGGRKSIDQVIQVRAGRAHVVPPGPAGNEPPELMLQDERMPEIIKELSADYQLVIMQSPAVDSHADALALAALCHGVLLLAPRKMGSSSAARKTVDAIRAINPNVLGIVTGIGDGMNNLRLQLQPEAIGALTQKTNGRKTPSKSR